MFWLLKIFHCYWIVLIICVTGIHEMYGSGVNDLCKDVPPSLKHLTGEAKVEYSTKNYTVHRMQQIQPSEDAVELYTKVKVVGEPLNIDNSEREVLMFPDLYPSGIDSPVQRRYYPVRPREVFAQRVNSFSGKRFRENCQWIMFLENLRQRQEIKNAVFASINTSRLDKDLTAKTLLNQIENKQLPPGVMSNHFSKMPLTDEFWNLKRSKE